MEEVFYQQVTRTVHAASREHASEHALNNEAMSLRSGELALRIEESRVSGGGSTVYTPLPSTGQEPVLPKSLPITLYLGSTFPGHPVPADHIH